VPGIAELALGAAPLAGGALLGVIAGNIKGPDFRALILKDLDLLDRIPEDRPELREGLKRSIDQRIADLIETNDRSRQMRTVAMSYQGDWRDIFVFICAVLFTVIWWNVKHDRPNWLVMFIAMIVLCIATGIYAARGLLRALFRRHRQGS
jgi:hypothetical protein